MDASASPLPTDPQLYKPVLEALSDGGIHTVDEIVSQVIEIMKLPEEATTVESRVKGKTELKYRIEWTLTRLKKKGLVSKAGRAARKITNQGLQVLNDGIDPQTLNDVELDDADISAKDESLDMPESFFDYLSSIGLEYDTRTVEDFLLSLKAKMFVILSGTTGTGKTMLAKAYGDFISGGGGCRQLTTKVTISDKSYSNGGFTLSTDDFYSFMPQASRCNGVYGFKLGDYEGKAKITMTPRFAFIEDDGDTRLLEEINRLKDNGADKKDRKEDLTLYLPGRDSGSKRYAVVPVGSNWTDGRHILGYRNAISGAYSRTASLDLLIRANDDPTGPYILILDEMNMSQVERYLADLISCMESGEPVVLDSDGSDGMPEWLLLGENLFVVGTVNMDETTQSFSPKVLDRANVIEFSPSPVSSFLTGESPQYSPAGDVSFLQDPSAGLECRSMTARDIIEEISGKNPWFGDAVTEDLEEIQNLMSGIGMSFGYRTLNEVMRFMYVAWKYEGGEAFDTWKRYMDDQILQKILPKVRGNSSILKCLTELRDFCAGHGYERSNEKLTKMVGVLESQRYVSFDCR